MRKLRKKNTAWLLLWIALTIVVGFVLIIAVGYIIIAIATLGSIIGGTSDFLGSERFGLMIGGTEFVVMVIVAIISKHFWRRFNTRCDTCKRFGALEFVKTKALREESISILVDMKQKNLKGDIIGTQEQYIPGKRIEYEDMYKCKYCGAIEYYTRSVDKKSV